MSRPKTALGRARSRSERLSRRMAAIIVQTGKWNVRPVLRAANRYNAARSRELDMYMKYLKENGKEHSNGDV